MITIRLLGPGDEAVLGALAADGAAFERDPHTAEGSEPLSQAEAEAFLADPTVRYWVAFDGAQPVGELFCVVHRVASKPGREVLLYEIGVHRTRRREGIGRTLLAALDQWLATTNITSVWVLADNDGAAAFYQACGYDRPDDQPTYLERSV